MMYDLIVIGDDLAAHVAAAYAGHHGINTLLISEKGLGGIKLFGDFVFNIDPTPITGLSPEQTGWQILKALGIEISESESAKINPAYQVILPEHRIDFFNSPEALFQELAREFPGQDADIQEFYEAAQSTAAVFQDWINRFPAIQPHNIKEYVEYLKIFPHLFRYKFAAAKFDKVLSENPALEKVWEAQHALTACNLADIFSVGSAFQYCAPFRGISCFQQGKQVIFNELIKQIESKKGLHLDGYEVVTIKPGKIIDLEIKSKDGQISKVSSHHLIISSKSGKLSLLFNQAKPANSSERFRPTKTAYYPLTIYLGIARKCLPEQLARHIAVVCDIEKNLFDSNLIILDLGLPEKDRSLSEAKTTLSATIFLSPDDANWAWDTLKQKANEMFERLEYFLPFLKDNVEFHQIDQSIDLSIAAREVVTPKYEVRNGLLTSFAAKTVKTRFANVYLTGAQLLPDAGFDAEILSGKNAVDHVVRKRKALHDT